MEKRLGQHVMKLDYEKIENSVVLDLKERALYPIRNQNALNELIENVCIIVTALLSIVSLGAVLLQTNILLIFGLFLFCMMQFVILKKIQKNMNVFYEKLPVSMRKSIYYENIAADYKPLKEIQIYRAKELLLDKLKQSHQDNVELFAAVFQKMECKR